LKLRWKPLGAQVSADGRRLDVRQRGGRDQGRCAAVKYVTVWRREGDGSWKVVADIGAAGDAEPAPGRDLAADLREPPEIAT